MARSDHLPPNSYTPRHRGPGRPVDRRQESYAPSPYAPQRTPPHGDVSPDGTRPWPQPSLTSRILVYGGAAVAAAAATAGGVLAVRKIADLVTGNDDLDREADRAAEKARDRVYDEDRGRAPGFAKLSEAERSAMRARAQRRAEEDRAAARRLRAEAERGDAFGGRQYQAPPQTPPQTRPSQFGPSGSGNDAPRPRRPRSPQPDNSRGFLGEIEHTAESLTRNINGIVGAVGAAMAAFRSVSGQAEGILREFGDTADQLRNFLSRGQGDDPAPAYRPKTARRAERDPYQRPARRDVVDLRDIEVETLEAIIPDEDGARTHRL